MKVGLVVAAVAVTLGIDPNQLAKGLEQGKAGKPGKPGKKKKSSQPTQNLGFQSNRPPKGGKIHINYG